MEERGGEPGEANDGGGRLIPPTQLSSQVRAPYPYLAGGKAELFERLSGTSPKLRVALRLSGDESIAVPRVRIDWNDGSSEMHEDWVPGTERVLEHEYPRNDTGISKFYSVSVAIVGDEPDGDRKMIFFVNQSPA